MGTIFVAYGGLGQDDALEFAAQQAAASVHDLLVHHVQESAGESVGEIREGIASVIRGVDPDVAFETRIDARSEVSDRTNISTQKRLVEAILDGDRDYEYVVMGDIERGSVDGLAHASLTEAVLETHAIPVMLVPV